MQYRELAEQVLFGTTLDDKLVSPAKLVDEAPGAGLKTPAAPGRPDGLQFASGGSRGPLPGLRQLEQEQPRGRLLHFFANHELLATELMALVLLKFPDAPPAFRKGILRTLKDEQEHTRLYIERMRKLGVEFGQFPVNGFFWKTISTMNSPMDYVSRLSLTFEQANLDYSRCYSERFARVGDTESAELLERIYRDEIAHVSYGLKWFRRWKDPGESDWEAFGKQLSFPLSASRAKAAPFNAEGRLRAGLDRHFINELRVYSKSRGRPPGVHVFNPFAELSIGRGKGFHPNKHQQALVNELDHLPMFLCAPDDVVLVRKRPRTEFLIELQSAGFEPPEFVELEKGRIPKTSGLRERKIGHLRPWAWSPSTVELFEPLLPNLSAGTPAESPADGKQGLWNEKIARLHSKATAAACLRQVLEVFPDAAWLCGRDDVGQTVADEEGALAVIDALRRKGYRRLVIKQLHGAAAHGMLRLWEEKMQSQQLGWIRNSLQQQGALLIEPWRERVLDFSCQWEFQRDRLRRLGFVRMENDARGQFAGSIVRPSLAQGLPQELRRFLHGPGRNSRLKEVYETIGEQLEPRLRDAGFDGPLGIDAFVFRDPGHRLRLKPIVEINARYTFGRVMLELMKHACPGTAGHLRLLSTADLRRLGCASFTELARLLQKENPLQLEGEPRPRMRGGTVVLNDPESAQSCLAVLEVRAG